MSALAHCSNLSGHVFCDWCYDDLDDVFRAREDGFTLQLVGADARCYMCGEPVIPSTATAIPTDDFYDQFEAWFWDAPPCPSTLVDDDELHAATHEAAAFGEFDAFADEIF